VRSVVIAEGTPIESDDSVRRCYSTDTFPPAAPQNVVLAEIPGENGQCADLSWSINSETDLEDTVYRSEQHRPTRPALMETLWLSPAYRDSRSRPDIAIFIYDHRAGSRWQRKSVFGCGALDLTQPPQ